MDTFSLEDEDYGELFLTQQDSRNCQNSGNLGLSAGVGEQYPRQPNFEVHYSDISDDDFEFPASQNYSTNYGQDVRLVVFSYA